MESAAEHRVLARKYRPQKFGEVVEQETTVRALQNALAHGRLGSAYLFFGARGVGKTTIARILAKRVNCSNVQDGEPCDRCESCLSILNGSALDVIEIDAASNRGIHNIRELRENVRFQPMAAKKKVYIIDEVHMLTTESFNALLKTLEEPPAHALFILATTELNKIPETILSRCQVFNFRKAPLRVIQEHLRQLCAREKIQAEDEALFWIARRGDGSFRDSLSFLEQAMVYCGAEISAEKVKTLIGHTPNELFVALTSSLLDPSAAADQVVRPVHEVFSAGGDLSRFIWEYLDFLRVALYLRRGVDDAEFLGAPQSELKRIQEGLDGVDPQQLARVFDRIYGLLTRSFALRLRNSYETRVLIEMELLEIRELLLRPSISGVIQKLNQMSAAIQQEVSGKATAPRSSETPAAAAPIAAATQTEDSAQYSAEYALMQQFRGVVVDPAEAPRLESDP